MWCRRETKRAHSIQTENIPHHSKRNIRGSEFYAENNTYRRQYYRCA